MFYLVGEKECLRTLILVVANGHNPALSISSLKKQYADFVAKIGGEETRPVSDNCLACYNLDRIKQLIAKFTDYSSLTDLETDVIETPTSVMSEVIDRVSAAIEKLGQINPSLERTFRLFIHTLFYYRSYTSGGGSVSSAPGVIWCAPRRNWSQDDISEFLVHELAHNILFIDERRFGHYINHQLLTDKSNYALSAVLKIPRPLDKVFHSLVVANEILNFRQESGEPANPIVHPLSIDILKSCRDTIASIYGITRLSDLVMPRFLEILHQIENHIESFENKIKNSLVGV